MGNNVKIRGGRKAMILLVTCSVLVAGACLGEWWFFKGSGPGCGTLLDDDKIQQVLGEKDTSDLGCDKLGESLKSASGGDGDRHTLKEALAMRKILIAISDSLPTGEDPELVVDSALRQPIAEALVDYTADTQKIMTRGDRGYSQNGGPSRHTWKDSDGGHMSVTSKVLARVMRAVSDGAESYSTLWTASTSRITGQMDRIPRGEGVDGVRSIAVDGARVMGTLQAIHFDAIRDADNGDDSSIVAQKISDEVNTPENMMAYLVGDWARERGIDVHRKDVEEVAMDASDAQNDGLQYAKDLLGSR